MNNDIIIQKPAQAAQQLILIFHGFGADVHDLVPIGEHLGQLFPQAMIVSMGAPDRADFGGVQGSGFQWFPISFPTSSQPDPQADERRFAGVTNALPSFRQRVQDWHAAAGLGAEATALFGFSQGGIMALEAAKQSPTLAGRIFAHSSRFAVLPDVMAADVSIHLIHGKTDAVITYDYCLKAAERLQALGADFTADVIPFLAHSINAESLGLVSKYLQSHIPKHRWTEAMQAAKNLPS